jgi:hypothetical protein
LVVVVVALLMQLLLDCLVVLEVVARILIMFLDLELLALLDKETLAVMVQ